MPNPSRAMAQARALLLQAERDYTPQAYARALAALEELPDQDDEEVRFCRAAVQHALAELRGDVEMLRAATAEYERILRTGALGPRMATLIPQLVEDCHAQIREADGERRRG